MGEREGAYRVWWGNLRDGDYLEDLDEYGRIILTRGVGRINLDEDPDKWRALVNMIMNRCVS
jgi:hypothetical protein